MEKFAFIFHPLSIKDMEHVSPIMKYIPDKLIEAGLKLKRPFKVSHIMEEDALDGIADVGLKLMRRKE